MARTSKSRLSSASAQCWASPLEPPYIYSSQRPPQCPFITKAVPADTGIVNTAKKLQCDVVVMGSHGRRGLATAVIGSVTH
ncbi:MAG TPA: universal stress protein [Burkholderiales bacterium]|nr:universal stress protein [Burkholderiales bacterium]